MKYYNSSFVDVSDETSLKKFIEEASKTFSKNDTFETKEEFNLRSHYHNDFESRLFLEGNATFIINGEPLECSKGSYIEIFPNVVHSFFYDGKEPLKVLRFFSENENWEATFID